MNAHMAVRSGRATRAVDVVERRRGGAAWPVIWTVRRPGTPAAEPFARRVEPAVIARAEEPPVLELRPVPYARGRGSRRLATGSSPTSTGRRNLDSYSSAREARAAAALSLIALFRRLRG